MMIRSTLRSLALFATASLIAACGLTDGSETDDSNTPGVDSPTTISDTMRLLTFIKARERFRIESECRELSMCPEALSAFELASARPQMCDDIEVALDQAIARLGPDRDLRISYGERAEYNAQNAETCLESWRTFYTSQECKINPAAPPISDACKRVYIGKVAIGEACVDDNECAGDATCEPRNDTDACDKACTERDDAICGDTPCPVPSPLGQPCDGVCVEGLLCAADVDGDGSTCVKPYDSSAGEPCTQDEMCVEGTLCRDSTCTAVTSASTQIAASQPCGVIDTESACSPGLACTGAPSAFEQGVCGAYTEDGQPCVADTQCAFGSVCLDIDVISFDDKQGICGPPRAAGEACAGGANCASYTCDEQTNTCVSEPVCPTP